MPTRVTFWVKRSSPLVHEKQTIPKKQRTNNLHGIHSNIKSEIVNARGEVTIKTEEIDDGSTGESFLDMLGIKKHFHRI